MSICILLSTFNGEKYIEQLLESINNQRGEMDITILVRDDGSADSTCTLINNWKQQLNIEIYKHHNVGAKESFIQLLQMAPNADYYAFADQDDVWLENKLLYALQMLSEREVEKNIPLLYACNVQYVDENLDLLPSFRDPSNLPITIQRIFVSNFIQGCTMVFNKKLYSHLINLDFSFFYMHDIATILTALSVGEVMFDFRRMIYYRQHGDSVTQKSAQPIAKRISNSIEFWFHSENQSVALQAMELYKKFKNYLSPNKKLVLKLLINYRHGLNRFKIIMDTHYRSDQYRENRSFILRVLLGLA